MSDADRDSLEKRVIILVPTSKDAALTRSLLDRIGVDCLCCSTLSEVCRELENGAGALLLAEEAIIHDDQRQVATWLSRQPPWSDLPVLLVARPGADSSTVTQGMERLGNVTVLERPIRLAALVSAVRSALRARQRQYQIRDYVAERERSMEAQARLAAIVASSDDAIISKSLEGNIRTWNAGAERLFGYSADEAIGQPITLLIPPERDQEEPNLLERLRRGERIEHFETVRITKSGQRVDVSLTVSPIWDADGRIIGASKVARDITEKKQAEEALREADRRKDEFLATLAHELRNPLAPISNALEVMRMTGELNGASGQLRDVMERQVGQLVRLVNDLMEVSRISRGKIELRKEPVELSTILRTALDVSRPFIEEAGHQLTVTQPPGAILLDADQVRLSQVLTNLLTNAAKYMEPGGLIELTVCLECGEACISVRDTGLGIPPHMLSRVFEMFCQMDHTRGRAQGGLGIGLALAKSLIEMHGGRIEARSEGLGRGSQFVVRLPVADESRRQGTTAPTRSLASPLPARKVLVVDDTRAALFVLDKLLTAMGQRVRTVPDALSALESARFDPPDIVLSDIGMPDMDGYELARRMRQTPELNGVVLVALTGYGQISDRQRAKEAGFDHHLVKPVDANDLRNLLATLPCGPSV